MARIARVDYVVWLANGKTVDSLFSVLPPADEGQFKHCPATRKAAIERAEEIHGIAMETIHYKPDIKVLT